jgi:hypothetical protein
MAASPPHLRKVPSADGPEQPSHGDGNVVTDRRRGWRVLMFAARLLAMTSAGHAQTSTQAPKPAQIDRNGVLILIRSSLLALDHPTKPAITRCCATSARPAFKPTRRHGSARFSPSFATTISICRCSRRRLFLFASIRRH